MLDIYLEYYRLCFDYTVEDARVEKLTFRHVTVNDGEYCFTKRFKENSIYCRGSIKEISVWKGIS